MGQRPISTGRPPRGQQVDDAAFADSTSPDRQRPRNSPQPAAELDRSRWTDGSEPEPDDYGDDGDPRDRKLSKAERKRLRKLKAQRRVA